MRSEQLVDSRLLRVVEVADVPEQGQAAARTEHAPDLTDGLVGPEPVRCLRARDCVDACVGEWDRFSGAGERFDAWDHPLELGAHGVDRLDSDDAGPQRDELARELARACGEVEHVASGPDAEPLRDPRHGLVRIARASSLVHLRGGGEAGFRRRVQRAHQ